MPDLSRRRSERILLTIPIRVEGLDAQGKKFSENSRTLVINRHGACIQLRRPIAPGVVLQITNLMANRAGPFQVVGHTQTVKGEMAEWGVECREENKNIWGIDFPAPDASPSSSSGLLECAKCHNVSLMPLSSVELDVLSASGGVSKECKTCQQTTTWATTDKSPAVPPPGKESPPSVREVLKTPRPTTEQRRHARTALRMPIRLRNAQGVEEMAKTENVSLGGLAFISEREYKVGEVLQVVCPYNPRTQAIEVPARVVWFKEMKGTNRKVYGLCYQR